jgi:hypothetical protein
MLLSFTLPLSRCLVLTCLATSLSYFIASSCCHHPTISSPCCVSRCFIALCLPTLRCLATLLFHYHHISSTSWHPPFVALLPCCLAPCCIVPHYFIPYVGWHFPPPSSLTMRTLEFGGTNSLAPREKVIFFGALFSFVCFLCPSSFFVLDFFNYSFFFKLEMFF